MSLLGAVSKACPDKREGPGTVVLAWRLSPGWQYLRSRTTVGMSTVGPVRRDWSANGPKGDGATHLARRVDGSGLTGSGWHPEQT
jgi:hypothetical protein